jgi:hypothetical protein
MRSGIDELQIAAVLIPRTKISKATTDKKMFEG